jgi:hypothetical protein
MAVENASPKKGARSSYAVWTTWGRPTAYPRCQIAGYLQQTVALPVTSLRAFLS